MIRSSTEPEVRLSARRNCRDLRNSNRQMTNTEPPVKAPTGAIFCAVPYRCVGAKAAGFELRPLVLVIKAE